MRRHPGSAVEPKRYEWGNEVTALHGGLVDVAFVWLPADTAGLHTEVMTSERRMAGLAAGHRLADRAELSIMDLSDEPIVWTRRAPAAWVDWWAVNPDPTAARRSGGRRTTTSRRCSNTSRPAARSASAPSR